MRELGTNCNPSAFHTWKNKSCSLELSCMKYKFTGSQVSGQVSGQENILLWHFKETILYFSLFFMNSCQINVLCILSIFSRQNKDPLFNLLFLHSTNINSINIHYSRNQNKAPALLENIFWYNSTIIL